MSDFDSSLPVRTQTNGDVAVKLVDGTTVAQAAAIDASGNLSVDVQELAGNATATNNGVTNAGTLRVTLSSDSTGQVTVLQPTASNLNATVVQPTGTNLHTVVDSGTITVTQSTAANLNATVTGTVAATQSGSWTVAATESGTWTVQPGNTPNTTPWLATINQGGNSATVTASNALKVDGSAVTQPTNLTEVGGAAIALGQTTMANSVPVVIASNQSTIPVSIAAAATGTNVNHYATTASVAANATTTNTYAVTGGKTLSLGKIWATGSGKIKIVVQTGPSAGLVTQYVGFNSTANPNIDISLAEYPIPVPSTSTGEVVITITNLDNQSQDVYSTINGVEN